MSLQGLDLRVIAPGKHSLRNVTKTASCGQHCVKFDWGEKLA